MQCTVMAFGLKNVPAIFHHLMCVVLGGVPQGNVYLDDVAVYSNDWSSHISSFVSL